MDHLRIVGNTTGASTNRWLSLGGSGYIGSVYIADNNIQGDAGLPVIVNSNNNFVRGPMVVANNNAVASNDNGIYGDIVASHVDGVAVVGNSWQFDTDSGKRAVSVQSGQGAIIGNNQFANARDAFFVDSVNQDVWAWDNSILDDANWSSDTVITEQTDSYLLVTPYSDSQITGGEVRLLMRKVDGTSEITGGGMTTTGDLAAVIVDSNGDLVRGWTSSETAKYNGDALPLLGVAPTIYTDPASQDIATGDTATLQVVPQGSAPFSYQWYKNGTLIQDATARTYTTGALDSSNDGDSYTVTVTNKYGSITSSAATLTVAASSAPSITTQPVAGEATEGRSATFSVTATGSDAMTYQWQLDDGSGWADIDGAVSSQYTTPDTVLSESGNQYRVIVTNDYGTVTSNAASLTVSSAVSVSEDFTGTDGDSWDSQWTVQPIGSTVINTDIQSNEGRAYKGYFDQNGSALAYINTATGLTADQTAQFRHSSNATGAGLIARGYDSNNDGDIDTFYALRATSGSGASNSNYLAIYKHTPNGTTKLANAGKLMKIGVDQHVRFVVETTSEGDTRLRGRMWDDGQTEPTEWDIDITRNDAELDGVSGRFGIFFGMAYGNKIYTDDYTATAETGGDNLAPTAAFTTEPDTGAAPLVVQFNAADSRDPDGDDPTILHRYHWDFGDGSDPVTTLYPDIRHEYTQSGSYTVTLTVNDAKGAIASTTASVSVAASTGTGAGEASDDWTGSNGDPWDSQWTIEPINGTVMNADIQSNQGRIYKGYFDQNGGGVTYINDQSGVDVDQTVDFYLNANGGSFGLVARAYDSNSDGEIDTFYALRAQAGSGASNNNYLSLYKHTPSGAVVISRYHTSAGLVQPGTNYHLRFVVDTDANGDTLLRGKVWEQGTTEPTAWQLDVTRTGDTELDGVDGRFGMYYGMFYNVQVYSDNYDANVTSIPVANDDWTGSNGDPWDSQWTIEPINGTVMNADIQSNQGRIYKGYFDQNGGGVTYINDQSGVDVDQTVDFYHSSNGASFGLVARAYDSNSDGEIDTFYALRAQAGSGASNNNYLSLYKHTPSGAVVISRYHTGAGLVQPGTNYHLRFVVDTDANGDTVLRGKVWEQGTTEPTAWQLDVTRTGDTELDGVDGRFGMYYGMFYNVQVYSDNYSALPTGAAANQGNGLVLNPATPPSHIANLSATAASDTQIDLSWTDQSGVEDGYRIERSLDGRSNWTVIADLADNTTSYSDTGLDASTRYWYRIIPYREGAEALYPSVVAATTDDATGEIREYWSGYDYTNWDPKWTVQPNGSTVINTEIRDYAGRVFKGYSEQNGTALAYINTTSAEQVDAAVDLFLTANGGSGGLVARAYDSDSDGQLDTYYALRASSGTGATNSNYLSLYKHTPSGVTKLAGSSQLLLPKHDYRVRFVVETLTDGSTRLRAACGTWGTPSPAPGSLMKRAMMRNSTASPADSACTTACSITSMFTQTITRRPFSTEASALPAANSSPAMLQTCSRIN